MKIIGKSALDQLDYKITKPYIYELFVNKKYCLLEILAIIFRCKHKNSIDSLNHILHSNTIRGVL